MKTAIGEYLRAMRVAGLLITILLLWTGCGLYYSWTISTLPGRYWAGVFLSGMYLPLNLCISFALGVLLIALTRNMRLSSIRKMLLAISPAVAISLGWSWFAYDASRPEVVFGKLFLAPTPTGASGLEANGTAGMDGDIWVISLHTDFMRLEQFSKDHGFVELHKADAEEHYRSRILVRAGAHWRLAAPIKVFRQKTNGVERLILCDSNGNAHFLFCTYGHDF